MIPLASLHHAIPNYYVFHEENILTNVFTFSTNLTASRYTSIQDLRVVT